METECYAGFRRTREPAPRSNVGPRTRGRPRRGRPRCCRDSGARRAMMRSKKKQPGLDRRPGLSRPSNAAPMHRKLSKNRRGAPLRRTAPVRRRRKTAAAAVGADRRFSRTSLARITRRRGSVSAVSQSRPRHEIQERVKQRHKPCRREKHGTRGLVSTRCGFERTRFRVTWRHSRTTRLPVATTTRQHVRVAPPPGGRKFADL